MKRNRTLVVAALAAVATLGLATSAEAGIDRRQERQRIRINEGWKSGELTRCETAGLLAQQRHIRREEARYRRSGDGLGPRERLALQRDLQRANQRIVRQKHDGQTRR